jgi:hypothetical protein
MRKFDVWRLAMLLHHIDQSLEVIKPMAEDSDDRDERLTAENVSTWLSANITTAQVIALENRARCHP